MIARDMSVQGVQETGGRKEERMNARPKEIERKKINRLNERMSVEFIIKRRPQMCTLTKSYLHKHIL